MAELLPGSGLADQCVVVDAVVRPLDFEDLVPPGVGAGDADRVHRALGAAVGEPDRVDGVPALRDGFGGLDQQLAGFGVQRPLLGLVLDRLDERGVGVAAHPRAVVHPEVEVAVPVDVLQVDALRVVDVQRVRRPLAERAADRRRDVLGRLAVQLPAPGRPLPVGRFHVAPEVDVHGQ
jgi:hypothetical protein